VKTTLKIKNLRGFTLVELLVVIAIIGILMGIVVLGINPAERINEAKDAKASANVRSVATGMEACITINGGAVASCATSEALAPAYITAIPTGVTVSSGCVWQLGRTGKYYYYSHTVGEVKNKATSGC